jgi:predicted kinase
MDVREVVRHDADVLVGVSCLPGAGMSSLADAPGQKLAAAVVSSDPIQAAIWRCGVSWRPTAGSLRRRPGCDARCRALWARATDPCAPTNRRDLRVP